MSNISQPNFVTFLLVQCGESSSKTLTIWYFYIFIHRVCEKTLLNQMKWVVAICLQTKLNVNPKIILFALSIDFYSHLSSWVTSIVINIRTDRVANNDTRHTTKPWHLQASHWGGTPMTTVMLSQLILFDKAKKYSNHLSLP